MFVDSDKLEWLGKDHQLYLAGKLNDDEDDVDSHSDVPLDLADIIDFENSDNKSLKEDLYLREFYTQSVF